MKIQHFSFSTTGGAGIVAQNLVSAQLALGHEAKLNAPLSRNLQSQPLRKPMVTASAILDRYLIQENASGSLFSYFRNRQSDPLSASSLRGNHLHLHWIAGQISMRQLVSLKGEFEIPSITWTLHDAAAFTGGCHVFGNCRGFTSGCASCPQVRAPFKRCVELAIGEKVKVALGDGIIKFVAPSEWMAISARQSLLLRNADIEVIPNPLHVSFFEPQDKVSLRRKLNIPDDAFVGIAISSNLSDPHKQIQKFVDDFEASCNHLRLNAFLILVGENGGALSFRNKGTIIFSSLGHAEIAQLIAVADLHGLYSKSESASLTFAESAVLGIPTAILPTNQGTKSLAQATGGLYVVSNKSGLIEVISAILKRGSDEPRRLMSAARNLFSSAGIANKYLAKYVE